MAPYIKKSLIHLPCPKCLRGTSGFIGGVHSPKDFPQYCIISLYCITFSCTIQAVFVIHQSCERSTPVDFPLTLCESFVWKMNNNRHTIQSEIFDPTLYSWHDVCLFHGRTVNSRSSEPCSKFQISCDHLLNAHFSLYGQLQVRPICTGVICIE